MAVSIGGAGADSFTGTASSDFFAGEGGADTLRGGLHVDTLNGGDGDDLIEGGRAFDRLSGGAGNDTFLYTSRLDMAGDRITDFAVGDRIDLSALGPLVWGFDYGASGAANELRYRTATLDNGTVTGTEIVLDLDGDNIVDGSIFLVGTHRLQMLTPGIITAVAHEDRRGTAQGDTLSGGFGQDTLRGFAGADSLNGGDGNDRLFGGDGNDTLRGGGGADIMVGGAGDDVFQFITLGQVGGDQVRDLEAGDRIDLSAILGLRFIGDAVFSGTAGEMRYDASNITIDTDGDGILDRSIFVSSGPALEETAAGSRILRLASARVLNGTELANTLLGGAAADSLSGLDGDDSLSGGFDDDTLEGGAGADTLLGGGGNDILRAGDGNDLLIGDNGGDTLSGGAGNDVFRVTSTFDIGLLSGAAANTSVPGESGRFDVIADFVVGDLLDLSALGPLTLIGEVPFGFDDGELRFTYSSRFILGVNFTDLTLRIDRDGDAATDLGIVLQNFSGALEETTPGSGVLRVVPSIVATGTGTAETLTGGAAADTLIGGGSADTLLGLGGADDLEGEDGADLLFGGSGNDVLDGGLGNDTLVGGAGNDALYVLEGDDLVRLTAENIVDADTVFGFAAGDRVDLSAFANLSWGGAEFPTLFQNLSPFSFGASYENGGLTIRVNTDSDSFANFTLFLAGFNGVIAETAPGSRILTVVPTVNLTGTAAGETLTGAGAGDTLSGLGGADTLVGLGGADTLLGGEENDVLLGGSGNDLLTGGLGNDLIVGGAGIDVYNLSEGDDAVRIDALSDLGTSNSASVSGGNALETASQFGIGDRIDLSALGAFTWFGHSGFSSVASAAGPQAFSYSASVSSNLSSVSGTMLAFDANGDGFGERYIWMPNFTGLLDLTAPGSGILQAVAPLNLLGTAAGETLTGAAAADTLSGAEGNDTLVGGAGNDSLLGGIGNDRLLGGAGNDSLLGGEGEDTLLGGTGFDTFDVSMGNDRVVVLSLDELNNGKTITGFALGDVIDLSAIAGLSFLGTGSFTGVANQVRFNVDFSNLALQIDRDGNGSSDVSLSLGFGTAPPIEMASYGIFSVVAPRNLLGTTAAETLTGAENTDTIFGDSGNDALLGLGGADSLDGGVGSDRLVGGGGNDTLIGGAGLGADTIIGGEGSDRMLGGEGADRFVFLAATELGTTEFGSFEAISDLGSGDLLDFTAIAGLSFLGTAAFTGTPGQFRFTTITEGGAMPMPGLAFDFDGNGIAERNLRLPGFNGELAESASGSRILNVVAPLNIVGTAGAETLTGAALADTLSGLGANDTLIGNEGADSLSGGAGNDVLNGGVGADTLLGGAGGDTLTGGADLDRFVYADLDTNATAAGRDTILDFAAGSGELIDLLLMDANADLIGEQAFTFIGSAAFTVAGQVRFASGVLQGNTTGTTGAEFHIVLTGVVSLAATDLVL